MARLQPTITIGNRTLDPDWNHRLTALAGLNVVWGRQEAFDIPEPGQATIDVIDPDGEWASDPALYGAPVLITAPGSIVVFRGSVDQVAIRRAKVQRDDVWVARITATDALAQLAKIATDSPTRTSSPNYDAYWSSQVGTGYWSNDRLGGVNTRLGQAGVTARVVQPTGSTWPSGWSTNAPVGAGPSLLEIITAWLNVTEDVVTVIYRQDPDTIVAAPSLVQGSTLKLTYTGGKLVLMLIASGIRSIPAGRMEMEEGAEVLSRVPSNIGSIRLEASETVAGQVTIKVGGSDVVLGMTPKNTNRSFSIGPGQAELKIPTARLFIPADQAEQGVNLPWMSTIVNKLKGKVLALNGLVNPPPLTFDFERFSYGSAAETAILSATPDTVAWAFPGATFADLIGFSGMFALVGGSLTWDDGWAGESYFVPAIPGSGNPVTYATWVTNTTARWMDFDPAITWADFALTTQGAA